jgi:hypothetical protein
MQNLMKNEQQEKHEKRPRRSTCHAVACKAKVEADVPEPRHQFASSAKTSSWKVEESACALRASA